MDTSTKATSAQTERVQWLDAARAFAIIAVVLCHVVEKAYLFFNPKEIATFSLQSKAFGILSFFIARLGVPIFLFLTGYLLITRHYDNRACIEFWKRRWLPLLFVVELWTILYSLFIGYMGKSLSIDLVIRRLLFIENADMAHSWYLPMILGLYLMLPVMAMALERLEFKTIVFPLAIFFASYFVVPTLNPIMQVFGLKWGVTLLNAGFSGGLYGIYIICGWAVAKGTFKGIRTPDLLSACVVCAALFLVCELWFCASGVEHSLWYSNALLFICALSLFELLSRRIRPIPFSDALSFISRYSFAVYLTHYPILMLLEHYALDSDLPLPASVLWGTLILFLLSLLTSWLISKTPIVGRPMLYLRSMKR